MRRINIKKVFALVLTFVMMMMTTGCSDFLIGIAESKVEDYTNDFISQLKNDPETAIAKNSQAEVEIPSLIDAQQALFADYMESASVKIGKIKVNEKRTKATVTITFEDVLSFDAEDAVIGTVGDLDDIIADLDTEDVSFDLVCNRTDKGWIFEDLSEVVEVIVGKYSEICVLDDEGMPLCITAGYVNSIYIDSYWYDPIQGNPTSSTSFSNVNYLENVFYFNTPMNMECVAELYREDELVDSVDVSILSSVVATCDFESTSGVYQSGEYTVVLLYNGDVIVESSAITVN